MHLRPRTLGLPGAAQVRWTAKTSAPRQPFDEDPFFWSDIGFLPPGSPGPAPVDGPGEDLIALFGDDGSDEWLEAINAVFAGVESTLAYLLCSDQEQEAIDVINLLSRFADGDISPLSNHADSNDPTDRPA
jgi:hypothetical protein